MLKVCGLKYVENLSDVLTLAPDFAGLIFYESSPRDTHVTPNELKELKLGSTKMVGVFVNTPIHFIEENIRAFKLDYVQLHGDESPATCIELKKLNVGVIKAFSVNQNFNFSLTHDYRMCDYFIFDTKGKSRGGNGIKFDWSLLQRYQGQASFLLSGGIGVEQAGIDFKSIHPKCVGVDINSKFEIAPGLKDVGKIKSFKETLCTI